MAKTASNLSTSNVNLLSNKVEGLSEIQQKIREQARLEIFQTLDLNARCTNIDDMVSDLEKMETDTTKKVSIGAVKLSYEKLKTDKRYKPIFDKYEKSDKKEMYIKIAERIILDQGKSIQYREDEGKGITKSFVENEYKSLNNEEKYKNNLDFFEIKDKNGNLYIIKRKKDEIDQIKTKEEELKNKKIEELFKLSKDNEEKDAKIKELMEQLGVQTDKSDTTGTTETTGITTGTNGGDTPNTTVEGKETGLTENKINEIVEKQLKKYLAPLLESQGKKATEEIENTENSEQKEENRESVEENPLYVSRHDVELSVAQCRATSDFPTGTIEIKGTSVKVEEFEFYEEMKQEYILAKGDTVKLQKLDKEFAELAILCSPKGAPIEQRCQIKLTEDEIDAGGLVVSPTRLAKYGLELYHFEYTNTIIEREYQEKIETIKKIETEITELTTIITELTTKVNIEKYSSEEILEEIRQKKARWLVLIRRQKELLKSLRKGKRITKIVDDDKHKNGELVFNEFKEQEGNIFYNECKKRKIKRIDGSKIPEIGGIDTAIDYVDAKGNILRLEPSYGSDDGDDTTQEGYRFVYTGKKQVIETIYGERRISLGKKFDGGAKGELFKAYCDSMGIHRQDNKPINPDKFDEDFMYATYVTNDGKELKLEFAKGGATGGDDNTLHEYEFVYYEGKKERDDDKVGGKLDEIIKDEEALYIELGELEDQLRMAKSESVRIEIEKKIKIIQEKLTTIQQKIIEITNITKTYKETTTKYRYRVYGARPIPVPDWKEPFEMTAVLSDMGTDVFREKASLKVEENLKSYYKSLGRWQVGSRLALFLGRGRRRKRMIRNEMNNMANTAFQTGAGYAELNDQSQNAADRHKHELDTNMAAVNQLATVHNVQVDQLCRDYLNNVVNDAQFQQQFNAIIANDANIQNILNGQNITHIGTNVLLKLQEQKALNQLILDMDAQLAQYLATGNAVHMNNMRNYVSQFIKDYQKTPAFMANFEQFVNGDLNAKNRLRHYLNHEKAIMNMQITNLRMNIDILNKGKSAYQIDNKDRETGKGSWKYRLGHRMDKHPRGTVLGSTAISIGIGLGTGLIASPVLAGAVSLGLFGGLVGTTNAVKKWTHHTKEQNTHEKNMVTDYRNEQAKIQTWQNQALNGHGRRRYKAKRQLALYDQTTQENIRLSDQITEYITNLSSKVGPLTADEDNFMRCNLIEGWARLKYYRQMGHNFLASEQVDKTEKDMKRLEKAITLGCQKIGQTTNNIEHGMTATNQLGTNITYDVIQNDLKASYDKSLIQFKRERRNLSLKYGFGTAIASIGVGAFFQRITHSGMWAGKDIAPTTTVTTKTGTEEFALGGSELTGTSAGTVEEASKSAFSTVTSGDTVNILYGAGTDGTKVVSTFDPLTKKADVIAHINGLSGMSPANKAQFVDYINSMPILTDNATIPAQELLNGNLATMRQYETLERIADGLAKSGKGAETLTLNFSPIGYTGPNTTAGAIAGMTPHTAAERFANGIIEIGHTEPGRKAVRRGRWFMGMPLFFNTFKDRRARKDTTDQNWGRGRGQQPNQPQANPNQPQVNPNQPQANPNQPRHP